MYYARQTQELGTLDYVLKLPDSKYDVAFKKVDGGYEPVTDLWGGHVSKQVGASCPMPNTAEGKAQHAIAGLMTKYLEHAAMNAAIAQGHQVETVRTTKDGVRQIVLRVA